MDHVWRVFENGKEYVVKHIRINVPCYDEVTGDGLGNDDWNFSCEGSMTVDRESSTITINATETKSE